MPGYSVDRQNFDTRLGGLAVQLRNVLDEVDRVASKVANLDDATLAGYGYNQTDIDVIRGFGSTGQLLKQTAYGITANPQGSNLMFWMLKLVGMN